MSQWYDGDERLPCEGQLCLAELLPPRYAFVKQRCGEWEPALHRQTPEPDAEILRWRFLTQEDAQKLGGLET